jgi:hypothetical protein
VAVRVADVSARNIEHRARQASDRAVRDTGPWLERLGRFGHVAIGLVYVTIGVLAAQAAFRRGGQTTDSHGALAWLVQAPFGHAILGALALGFGGYAMWRFVQAARDTERKGTALAGILQRLVYAFIGASYVALALSALDLARGRTGGGGDAAAQDWTAWLLAQPLGQMLVAAVGLGVVVVGLVQFYMAVTERCCDALRTGEMDPVHEQLVRAAGRIGFTARGVAFAIIGGLLLVAALHRRPDEAHGLGGALATLAQQPFGPWLLAAVATGLVLYGGFMLVQARYRRLVIR